MGKKEITFYQFLSNINNFITKIKKNPISAKPNKFLIDNDFGKEKLIRILINRNIISRKESIKDPTNSDEKTAKYYVKYTIIRDGYEEKIKKLYNDYFGKKTIDEYRIFNGKLVKESILNKHHKDMSKKIYLTESQVEFLKKNACVLNEDGEGGATTTFNIGDYTYDTPAFGKQKKGPKGNFFSDAIDRTPGLSTAEHIGDDGKVHKRK